MSIKEKWMSQLIADFFTVNESEANVSNHLKPFLTPFLGTIQKGTTLVQFDSEFL